MITEVLPSDTYRVQYLNSTKSTCLNTTTAHVSQLKIWRGSFSIDDNYDAENLCSSSDKLSEKITEEENHEENYESSNKNSDSSSENSDYSDESSTNVNTARENCKLYVNQKSSEMNAKNVSTDNAVSSNQTSVDVKSVRKRNRPGYLNDYVT